MPPFHYVYILESIPHPGNFYTGRTADLKTRLAKHNDGGNPHTTAGRPWAIKNALAFRDEIRAAAFQRYLKSPSGRAFAQKHF
jgi:predicted GIY-YIG superfamily endonuclease